MALRNRPKSTFNVGKRTKRRSWSSLASSCWPTVSAFRRDSKTQAQERVTEGAVSYPRVKSEDLLHLLFPATSSHSSHNMEKGQLCRAERASPAGMRPSRPSAVSFPSGSSQKSQKSARHAFNPLDDPRPIPFKFLSTHHLVITTAQGVYTCGSHGITEIFRSGSKGIVAAKRASSGSGILAVADDHLVILHDVRKGMQSSYRLRSADVCHRCSLPSQGLHTFIGSRTHAQICKGVKSPFLHHRLTRCGADVRSGALRPLGLSI